MEHMRNGVAIALRLGMKTTGMAHQEDALDAGAGKRNFAYLMEQGTGKTWTTIADSVRLYQKDLIDAMLVIAPNGVHSNWVRREIPTHVDIPVKMAYWKGKPTSKKARAELDDLYFWPFDRRRPLVVFAINIDAINTAPGYEEVERFLNAFRVMAVVDESTRIKNHTAKRSKKVVDLGKLAACRRILSGTPLTRAPTDLFMQFEFLKTGLLGTKSFRAFNAEFSVLLDPGHPQMIAIMRKLDNPRGCPQVVEKDEFGNPIYKNLEKLSNLIAPHSFRVTKKDALPNLPDKVYKVVYFDLTSSQRKIYNEVKTEYSFQFDNGEFLEDVSFEAIAARTKLKQVTSGFINIYGEPIMLPEADNPRFATFKDQVESLRDTDESQQVIIWAQYKDEMNQIGKYLEEQGYTWAMYNGDTGKERREEIIDQFQAGKIQYFVGHPAAAGIGITLTAAEVTIYYSCSEDNELRMQSEDRNHRIGTKNSVLYIDLVGADTIDEGVHRLLQMKSSVARQVIDRQPA